MQQIKSYFYSLVLVCFLGSLDLKASSSNLFRSLLRRGSHALDSRAYHGSIDPVRRALQDPEIVGYAFELYYLKKLTDPKRKLSEGFSRDVHEGLVESLWPLRDPEEKEKEKEKEHYGLPLDFDLQKIIRVPEGENILEKRPVIFGQKCSFFFCFHLIEAFLLKRLLSLS